MNDPARQRERLSAAQVPPTRECQAGGKRCGAEPRLGCHLVVNPRPRRWARKGVGEKLRFSRLSRWAGNPRPRTHHSIPRPPTHTHNYFLPVLLLRLVSMISVSSPTHTFTFRLSRKKFECSVVYSPLYFL